MGKKEVFWTATAVAVSYTVGRGILKRIDNATGEKGAAAGIKLMLNERNTHTTAAWEGDPAKTQEILADSTKPAILVSNHPYSLEPFMFLSETPPRKNLSIIAKAGGDRLFGEEFRKNIVRVYHPGRFETQRQKKKRQEQNKEQMREAESRLESGGSILIAPDGGTGSGRWEGGSVKLFEKALKLPEAYLVMANVPDSTENEHWRLVFKKKLERRVFISRAIKVKDVPLPPEAQTLPEGSKERFIVFSKALQDHYNGWVARGGYSQSGDKK